MREPKFKLQYRLTFAGESWNDVPIAKSAVLPEDPSADFIAGVQCVLAIFSNGIMQWRVVPIELVS